VDFFTFIIIVVAIGAGSSALSSIAGALKPKIRQKDIQEIKSEIKRELGGDEAVRALPDIDRMSRRMAQLEEQTAMHEQELEDLREENRFLKRLLDK
jgi:nicotinamide riboside kinase